MKNKYWVFLFFILFVLIDCKESRAKQEIEECDTMGNYYEGGDHYISREFYNDEEGTLRYDKLFEKSDRRNALCNPHKFEVDGP
jgi:hypothetical protein